MAAPTLYFDGACGFCRRWVERWKGLTGDSVRYEPSPEAEPRAVRLVEADGTESEGAAAVFLTLTYAPFPGPLLYPFYRRWPLFARLCERAYRLVAEHRPFFSRLTRWGWGEDLTPPTYHLARWLFLRGMSLCYLAAFLSFGSQARGLVGPAGIVPSLSEGAILGLAWGGAALSACLFTGLLPMASAAGLWLLYRQVYHAGGVFLGFQWDVLLLEAGALTVLAAPWGLRPRLDDERAPARTALVLVRWLWFRLMLLSGLVKLASGDPLWGSLTALQYHFETQPLPTALSWYAHHLPAWTLKAACGLMFFIELALPFAVFLPRRPRLAAFLGVNLLMLLIAATGNYTFFILLAFVLSLPLLDDSLLRRALPPLGGMLAPGPRPCEPRALRAVSWAFALFVLPTSLALGTLRLAPEAARWSAVRGLAAAGESLDLVNSYGLFAVMTHPRYELVVEGSADGRDWKPYGFRWKPGDPGRRPGWAQPHQPRLDWQMWFAALSPYQANPWYFAFLQRLLEGSVPVRGLLGTDPFAGSPPRFIRTLVYEYRFTDSGPDWWLRELKGLYCPVVTLSPDGRLAALAPPG